jgi:hypothetical protein
MTIFTGISNTHENGTCLDGLYPVAAADNVDYNDKRGGT